MKKITWIILLLLAVIILAACQANYIRDEILPKMSAVRVVADEAETMTDSKFWPFPTYGDLLFGVR